MLDVAGGVIVVETENADDSEVVQRMLSIGALGGREGMVGWAGNTEPFTIRDREVA